MRYPDPYPDPDCDADRDREVGRVIFIWQCESKKELDGRIGKIGCEIATARAPR